MSGMTRDRAIEILRDDANHASLWEIAKAVDMAIEALKERPHGEWIDKDSFGEEVYCSECGHMEKKEKFIWSDVNYCYFCGARMKEGEAE